MAIDRATIKIGPCKVSHDGATQFFPDGGVLAVSKVFVDIEVDAFGVMLRAHTDTTIEFTGTPKAWTTPAKLNPYASMAMGTLINGAVDKPLVITPINGKPLTIAAAAVKTPPNLMLSASKPMFGSCTWVGVLANNTAWSAAGARYSFGADASGVALTGLVKADMAFCTWAGVLGGVGFEHEDGIAIDFNVQLDEVPSDSFGIIDYSFGGIEVSVKYVPIGIGESAHLDALGIQGGTVARGDSAAVSSLVVTGSGTRSVTVTGLAQRSAGSRYHRAQKRVGEIELVSNRDHTAGVLNALFTLV
ncbi:MAG: hypothetical protein K0R17_2235 [Rariglobus sp.]|jgi:hypothetical protein|nr:hypothetical protein [Rariglobus sp.]